MVLRTSIQGAESGDLSGRVAQSLRWEGGEAGCQAPGIYVASTRWQTAPWTRRNVP